MEEEFEIIKDKWSSLKEAPTDRIIPKFISPVWYILGILLNGGISLIIYGLNCRRRNESTKGMVSIICGIVYIVMLVILPIPRMFLNLILVLNLLITSFVIKNDLERIAKFLNSSELEIIHKIKQNKKMSLNRFDSNSKQIVHLLVKSGFLKHTDETNTTVSLTFLGKAITSVTKK